MKEGKAEIGWEGLGWLIIYTCFIVINRTEKLEILKSFKEFKMCVREAKEKRGRSSVVDYLLLLQKIANKTKQRGQEVKYSEHFTVVVNLNNRLFIYHLSKATNMMKKILKIKEFQIFLNVCGGGERRQKIVKQKF